MRPALGLVFLSLLAGCGSAEGESPGPPRREDYVSQVDTLCRSANPKLVSITAEILRARDDARAGRAATQETFATFATLLERAQRITDGLLSRLRAIDPPPAEEDFHAALVDAVGAGASNVRLQRDAARVRDAGALRRLSVEGGRLNARSRGLVEHHGRFRHCGRA